MPILLALDLERKTKNKQQKTDLKVLIQIKYMSTIPKSTTNTSNMNLHLLILNKGLRYNFIILFYSLV